MGNCQISHHGMEKLLMQQRPLEYWRALAMIRIYLRRFKIKSGHAVDQGFLKILLTCILCSQLKRCLEE